jgi:hypothetical protein
MKRTLILALIAALGLGACSKKDEPAAQAPGMAAIGQMQNQGRVVQVLQAGSYTYIEALVGSGEKVWMAGAHLDAKVGDPIQWGNSSTMRNYQSKTLNRNFDQLLFVEAWSNGTSGPATVAAHGSMPNGGAAAMPGHPPMAGGAMPGHPPMGNAPAAAGGGNSGVVKSTTNAGGYSYVEIEQGSGTIWVAAPETAVKVGDKVVWDGGSVMQNFTARSLNRTFDQIVFAGGLKVVN